MYCSYKHRSGFAKAQGLSVEMYAPRFDWKENVWKIVIVLLWATTISILKFAS